MRCKITLNFCNGGDNVGLDVALRNKGRSDFQNMPVTRLNA
jgi:hypothetical protein